MTFPTIYTSDRVSKKLGISDLMCVCRLAFSHAMMQFYKTLGPDKCIGSDNKLHHHSEDDQEGLECTLVGHLEEIGCLKEYFVVFVLWTLHF